MHSGLKEARLNGNLNIDKKLVFDSASGSGIFANTSGSTPVLGSRSGSTTDIELNATGGSIHLGGAETSNIWLKRDLMSNTGAKTIADTSGNLYFQGESTDSRYVKKGSDGYLTVDLVGTSTYPRLVVQNGGASDNSWIRVGGTGNHGILPYSNGTSSLGTSSWRFRDVHAVTFYENGSSLGSKYAASDHNHDSRYVNKTGDTFTGNLVSTTRQSGVYGTYDSYKVDHIWSMGTGYKVDVNGANFGNLYGMAYKHTNNTAGGTMAGGHQIVFTSSGSPGAAIGMAGGFWTSGDVNAKHIMATNDLSGKVIYENGLALSTKYLSKLGTGEIDGDFTANRLYAGSMHADESITAAWLTINDTGANYKTSFQHPSIRIVTTNDAPNIGFYTGATNMGRVGFLESPTNVMKVENSVGDRMELRMNNSYFSFYTLESFYHRVINFGGAGIIKALNGSARVFQFRDSADSVYIDCTAKTFNPTSKREFKKNIEDLGSMTDTLMSLKARLYHFKEQEDQEQKSAGIIWDESPELIQREDSIDLYGLCTMLLQGFQESVERIEVLEKNQKSD